jgi:endonuclease/exonuclease/phosphatase family metal-dependent hydrolase
VRRLRLLVLAIAAFTTTGCDQKGSVVPTEPGAAPLQISNVGRGHGQFTTVLTRNLWVGVNLSDILVVPPTEIPQMVFSLHQELIRSLPAERMDQIAAEIAREAPDIVGLQEVFQVLVNGEVQFDFLELLRDGLQARNAFYDIAIVRTALAVELPALPPDGPLYLAGVVDREAILVRRGVQYSDAQAQAFDTYFSLDLGIAPPIPWRRGWTSVVAKVHGRDYRLFNTHLETQAAGSINVAQGAELIAAAANSPLPVLLVGDFNSAGNPSAPEPRKTATYGNILASGYADAWLDFGGGVDDGLTAYNEPADYDQRLDFVFFKGFRTADHVAVVGAEEEDRTASGLRASDHAGVVARIRLP